MGMRKRALTKADLASAFVLSGLGKSRLEPEWNILHDEEGANINGSEDSLSNLVLCPPALDPELLCSFVIMHHINKSR